MICKNCGAENPDGARFCRHCGAALMDGQTNPYMQNSENSGYSPVSLQNGEKETKFSTACFHAFFYLVLYFVVQIAVTIFASTILVTGAMLSGTITVPETEADLNAYVTDMMMPVYENLHTILIMSAAATLLILAIFFAMRRKKFASEIQLAPLKLPRILLIGVAAATAQIFLVLTISILPLPESVLVQFTESNSVLLGGSLWLQLLDVVIFTPILEEIIFRGLIFTRLRRGMSIPLAVILSALIFGIVHGTWIAFVYATLLGALMALLVLKYKTLAASIAFHVMFNAANYLTLPEEMPKAVFYILYAVSAVICVGAAALIVIDKEKEIKR